MISLFKNVYIPHLLIALFSLTMLYACGGGDSAAPTYSIGGSVSGLSGTLVLQNNGGSDKTITADGDFSFGSSFSDGTSYAVTVLTNPSGQGCTIRNSSGAVSGASVSNVTVTCVNNANPTGYYGENGTASVDDGSGGTIPIDDLQAMVSGNRLMMLSMSNKVVYDGTMTIVGNEYSTTLTIYETGVKTGTTTVSGLITTGSKIIGTMTGTKYGNGDFTINYSTIVNNMVSDLSQIETDSQGGKLWEGLFVDSAVNTSFEIATNGSVTVGTYPQGGVFASCELAGDYKVIDGSSLYEYQTIVSACMQNVSLVKDGALFTGLASTHDHAVTTLVFVYTSGDYAGYGEFILK